MARWQIVVKKSEATNQTKDQNIIHSYCHRAIEKLNFIAIKSS